MQHTELIVRIIIKQNDMVLLCKNKKHGHYFLPGGHVEFGDSLKTTVYKELSEELGWSKDDMTNISFVDYLESSYGEEGQRYHELNMIFSAKVREDIPVISQEDHIDFEWVSIEDLHRVNLLPKEIIPIIKSI